MSTCQCPCRILCPCPYPCFIPHDTSPNCVLCDNRVESATHLFLHCVVAMNFGYMSCFGWVSFISFLRICLFIGSVIVERRGIRGSGTVIGWFVMQRYGFYGKLGMTEFSTIGAIRVSQKKSRFYLGCRVQVEWTFRLVCSLTSVAIRETLFWGNGYGRAGGGRRGFEAGIFYVGFALLFEFLLLL